MKLATLLAIDRILQLEESVENFLKSVKKMKGNYNNLQLLLTNEKLMNEYYNIIKNKEYIVVDDVNVIITINRKDVR